MRFIAGIALVGALLCQAAFGADNAPPAAAAAPLDYYVIQLHLDMPDQPTPAQQQALLDHIGHLTDLYDQGVLFMAGPFESGTDGIAIVQAHSADEARGFEEADPSVQAGVMRIVSVDKWWAAFSRPDGQRFTKEQFMQMMQQPAPSSGGAGASGGSAAVPDGAMLVADAGGTLTLADLPEDVVAPETPAAPDAEPLAVDGALVHFELPSTDLKQSEDFYGKLFGWTFQDMGDSYALFMTPGGEGGGFTKDYQPGDGGGLFYIYAADVKAKLAEIKAAGGSVAMDTIGVPGYGWVALFADPQGNKVGLFSAENPPPGESPVPAPPLKKQ
jgi:predicted enzyme related to lactoylglutathione lyase/uncharacterized protein YciI